MAKRQHKACVIADDGTSALLVPIPHIQRQGPCAFWWLCSSVSAATLTLWPSARKLQATTGFRCTAQYRNMLSSAYDQDSPIRYSVQLRIRNSKAARPASSRLLAPICPSEVHNSLVERHGLEQYRPAVLTYSSTCTIEPEKSRANTLCYKWSRNTTFTLPD